MICAFSSLNIPDMTIKVYKTNQSIVIFYVLNTFIMNIILMRFIIATFYFYYQKFYVESVKRINAQPQLL